MVYSYIEILCSNGKEPVTAIHNSLDKSCKEEASEIVHDPTYIKFKHQHSSSMVIDFRGMVNLSRCY